MENALKGLIIAVGIIITCSVVGLGFYMAREANATASVSANQMSEIRKNMSESSIVKYDGMEVTGSDVINLSKKLLRKYDSTKEAPIVVTIKTSKLEDTYKNKEYLKKLTDFSNNRYVNPANLFLGTVVWDDNDVIVEIRFVEQ